MSRIFALTLLATAALAACEQAPPEEAAGEAPIAEAPPADMGVDMIGPEAGPAPEVVPVPISESEDFTALEEIYGTLAPSAGEPCADDGRRLPISGVCQGRAVNFVPEMNQLIMDAPEGCEWVMTEADFGMDALLFRALSCDGITTLLDYGGGAHAAELTYAVSPLYGKSMTEQVAVRVATYWDNDDWRLLETIPEEGREACEIRPAGEGYPASARVIAAKPGAEDADCGFYARGGKTDNFWIVREDYVYAFTLPKGERDLDPASLVVIEPH